MSDFESFDVPNGTPITTSEVEAPIKPRKRRWIKWTIGGVVIALFFGYQAFAAKPEVRLYKAITNWVNLAESDTSVSIVVTPELFTAAGVTDAQIAETNLPGVKTVADAVAAIDSIKLQLMSHKGDTPANDNSWLAASYGGEKIVQLGVVDRNLYLQIALSNLVSARPQVVTEEQINSALLQFKMLQSAGFTAIGDLIDGKTVKVSLAAGTSLGDFYDNLLAEQSGTNDTLVNQIQSTFVNGLRDASTVSEDGNEDGMDKFLIQIDGTKFADATADALFGALSLLNQAESGKTDYKNALRGKTFKFRIWLDGDTAKRIDFDLISVVKSLGTSDSPIAKVSDWASFVRLELGTEKIVAPSDAVDVTEQLTALLNSTSS